MPSRVGLCARPQREPLSGGRLVCQAQAAGEAQLRGLRVLEVHREAGEPLDPGQAESWVSCTKMRDSGHRPVFS